MLHPFSDFPTNRARLARVGRVNVHHGQSCPLRLVGHKVLQLAKSPPMQPCSDPFMRLDMGADMGQIFQAECARARTDGFGHDGFTDFVVDVFHMPLFTPRDSLEFALGGAATIGLETTAMGKVNITLMPQLTATPDLARTGSGEIVFSDIDAQDAATRNRGDIREIEDQIKVPDAFADDQRGFFGCATGKQIALMLPADKRNMYASVQGKQRHGIALDRIGALVEGDRSRMKGRGRNRFIFRNLQNLIGISHPVNGLTDHLAPQHRVVFPYWVVRQMVQSYPIPAPMFLDKRHKGITA